MKSHHKLCRQPFVWNLMFHQNFLWILLKVSRHYKEINTPIHGWPPYSWILSYRCVPSKHYIWFTTVYYFFGVFLPACVYFQCSRVIFNSFCSWIIWTYWCEKMCCSVKRSVFEYFPNLNWRIHLFYPAAICVNVLHFALFGPKKLCKVLYLLIHLIEYLLILWTYSLRLERCIIYFCGTGLFL